MNTVLGFFDAFISYGRADSKPFATKLNERLIAQGLNVWFDQDDIEDSVKWQKEIDKGIENTHNFIFIVAPHAVKSPYCRAEIELAVKYNKRLIPLLHVDPSHCWDKVHPAIGEIQFIPFQEGINDFESSFNRLLNSLRKHADYVEQHTNLLVKALEWLKNQKQTNYLLIGEDLTQAESWLKRRFKDEQPPCIPTDFHCEFISESTKNANNLMTHVFIAFSEKDRAIKDKISKTLMREGLTIWTNKTDKKTGTEFQDEINKGIEGADNFLYLMSSDSLASKYCQQELERAFAYNKRIIPLLIEDPGTTQIPSQLRRLQFIDLAGHEDPHKYQSGSQKLLRELKKEPSYYEKHKILLVKSLKWQRQNHNPSLLLRGYNLQHFEAWLKVASQRDDYPSLPLQEEFILASLNKRSEASLEVFISYSRTDSHLARKLNNALQELGKTTWFDQESIATGTDFQQEIYRGIESSDNFLFIISPKSVNSPYCADEVEYAQKLNKRFVTILHCPLSAKDKQKQPRALASVQYLDFNQHGREFAANFNELVRTLDTDRDHVRDHTKWSQRALEWQEKGSEDLLLRGSELVIAQNWLQEAEKNNKQPPATELQKAFIGTSADLRDRLKQAEANRRRREIRTAWGIAVGSVVAVAVSISLGLMAVHNYKQLKMSQKKVVTIYTDVLLEANSKVWGNATVADEIKVLNNHDPWNTILELEGKKFFIFRDYRDGSKVFASGYDIRGDTILSRIVLKSVSGLLNPSNDNMRVLISSGHCEIVSLKGSPSDPPALKLKKKLENLGYTVEDIAAPIDQSKLNKGDILIIGNALGNFTQSEIEAVEKFVKNEGGSLFVVGIGSTWKQYSADGRGCKPKQQEGQNIQDISTYPMNRLVEPYNMQWTADG